MSLPTIQVPTWPVFTEEMAATAARVLGSGKVNYWTGQEGRLFEKEFAHWVGSRHAVAVANGTLALEMALEVSGIGPGDDVVVPSRTFLATASAVVRVGARPVFADVDRDSGTLSAATIRAALTPKTRAVIPVHLGGWPAPMSEIMDLAREYSLLVVEDCAQAHGARHRGRMVGSWGHIGAFSFCQDKILTTAGEGGCLVTDDESTFKRLWALKDHGKSYDKIYGETPGEKQSSGFRWLHDTIGSNYRISEIHAAVGRIALLHLDDWIARRRKNAETLREVLESSPVLRTPIPASADEGAYYRLYSFVDGGLSDDEALRLRDELIARLQERGFPARTGACPEIYLERAFQERGLAPESALPLARALGLRSLEFAVHPTIDDPCLASMCRVLSEVLETVAS